MRERGRRNSLGARRAQKSRQWFLLIDKHLQQVACHLRLCLYLQNVLLSDCRCLPLSLTHTHSSHLFRPLSLAVRLSRLSDKYFHIWRQTCALLWLSQRDKPRVCVFCVCGNGKWSNLMKRKTCLYIKGNCSSSPDNRTEKKITSCTELEKSCCKWKWKILGKSAHWYIEMSPEKPYMLDIVDTQ